MYSAGGREDKASPPLNGTRKRIHHRDTESTEKTKGNSEGKDR
jgi:hypothetical protein